MKVCYLGISTPDFSRNRVYIQALRQQGVEVLEVFDSSPGIKKFFNLYKKHKQIKGTYDVLVVAYPGHAIVWFAKWITRKPVVFDALSSMYEAMIISRNPKKKFSLLGLKMWLIDFFACACADLVLVETNAQAIFYKNIFFVSDAKIKRVFTGVDETVFTYPDEKKTNNTDTFTVLFRGRFLPEAGVDVILKAAKILEHEPISFSIIGFGILCAEVEKEMQELSLPNVRLDKNNYPLESLPEVMLGHTISLGQLADHPRLQRTIPHKAFESAALKIPYVTARTVGVQELFTDGESALMCVPGDPVDLARVIMYAYTNRSVLDEIGEKGYRSFKEKASQKVLGEQLVTIFKKIA